MINLSRISNQSSFGRVLRAPLRYIPKSWNVRIVQGRLRGYRWNVGAGAHGFWLGCYEAEMQEVFARHIGPGSVVFDLGANIGFYSLLASHLVGPTGRVFSFEPLPANQKTIQNHLDLNRISNCTVMPFAVGMVDKTASFGLREHHSMGTLRPEGTDECIEVNVVALDTLCFGGGVPGPSLLKIDIEGAEAEALLGARRVISEFRPTIILSTHSDVLQRQCCEILRSFGYHLESLNENPLAETDEILGTPPRPDDAKQAAVKVQQ